jgi:hypothetical protein
MKKTTREKLVETILLYADDSNPISPQKLTRLAMASEEELLDMFINEMNARHKPFNLNRYLPK